MPFFYIPCNVPINKILKINQMSLQCYEHTRIFASWGEKKIYIYIYIFFRSYTSYKQQIEQNQRHKAYSLFSFLLTGEKKSISFTPLPKSHCQEQLFTAMLRGFACWQPRTIARQLCTTERPQTGAETGRRVEQASASKRWRDKV